MTEQRIEEITNVLKHVNLPSINRESFERKFIPKIPTDEDLKRKRTTDLERASENLIQIKKEITALNTLSPREQEREDKSIIEGLNHLFNNQFMAAKMMFEEKANCDPLHALALSFMAFLKAIMTSADQDQRMALDALNTTYDIANSQLEMAKQSRNKVYNYLSSYLHYLKTKENTSSIPTTPIQPSTEYPPNSVLRAYVLKAECCLQIAILQLLQESIIGYTKCGFNLRRAFNSYNYVWQEYQKMGADHLAFMDANTISAVQFGIGSVHLVLSALPAKILKAIAAFGWKPDKQFGFLLLDQCQQSKHVRSPMVTIMLLAYYITTMSFAPQIMIDAYKATAFDILLEAQKQYPNSAIYLFFAGRLARYSFDFPLSTQSFLCAADMSHSEWAEIAMTNSCRFEIALNHIMTGNWHHAADTFDYLCQQHYWSAAFCRYAQAACYEMIGDRTEAILAFAEVNELITGNKSFLSGGGGKNRLSEIDSYVLSKVTVFQKSGYQNLNFFTPLLEFMCIWNLFPCMNSDLLWTLLSHVQLALATIQRCERQEQTERMRELAPEIPLPDYFNERACLLVIKSSILNALGHIEDATLDINWILDHKDCISQDTWTVPYALWEAGVSYWKLNLKNKSRHTWEMALDYGKHDFEHRLAMRLNFALTYAEELGYTETNKN
ncbi:uncharacterized protein BX663DRAFT_553275 [Cokeromyces recurvatus]|uniref:uncharacterized protein n=1 Tax=Cokeromyces recurvatus TaxID=90255 RepID=UPI00221EE1E7|nr:uncharacterized protein BX663DRAFT_553275 [Cokeromyces recurvatus]KAI7901486.1 hypothetical protein BX663DRAFT_553275 [Cokeromyces recurvatus]